MQSIDSLRSLVAGDAPAAGGLFGGGRRNDVELPRLQACPVTALRERLDRQAVAAAVWKVFRRQHEPCHDDRPRELVLQCTAGKIARLRLVGVGGQERQEALQVRRLDERLQLGDERIEVGRCHRRLRGCRLREQATDPEGG